MSIAVVCSNCSAKLNAPDGAAGKKVKCPKCQAAIVVPAAAPPQFEVVEEEPPTAKRPAGKPARVKAVIEDDEDEGADDRPRKRKRSKGGDEEVSVSMTRNIVMGVLLIILVAVAAYVFYDRSQKQKELDRQSSSNSVENEDQAKDPVGSPLGRGQGQDSQVVKAEWTPDPELVKELKQNREIDRYEMLLPTDVTDVTGPKNQLPPRVKGAVFRARTLPVNPIGGVVVFVIEDREVIESARKNMGGFLYSQALAMQRPFDIQLDGRQPAEVGKVNGLTFTRFAVTGFTLTKVTPTKLRMRGLMYGALDGDRFIMILGMRFGEEAPTETNLLETSIATFKKS